METCESREMLSGDGNLFDWSATTELDTIDLSYILRIQDQKPEVTWTSLSYTTLNGSDAFDADALTRNAGTTNASTALKFQPLSNNLGLPLGQGGYEETGDQDLATDADSRITPETELNFTTSVITGAGLVEFPPELAIQPIRDDGLAAIAIPVAAEPKFSDPAEQLELIALSTLLEQEAFEPDAGSLASKDSNTTPADDNRLPTKLPSPPGLPVEENRQLGGVWSFEVARTNASQDDQPSATPSDQASQSANDGQSSQDPSHALAISEVGSPAVIFGDVPGDTINAAATLAPHAHDEAEASSTSEGLFDLSLATPLLTNAHKVSESDEATAEAFAELGQPDAWRLEVDRRHGVAATFVAVLVAQRAWSYTATPGNDERIATRRVKNGRK